MSFRGNGAALGRRAFGLGVLSLVPVAAGLGCGADDPNAVTLLNVSYDPTREFFEDFNKVFAASYKEKTGKTVNVKMSHGGSGKQARAVLDGLEADVVTLALAYDIDVLHSKGDLLPKDWATRLPENSAPYNSTIVFVVRKGNPKGIKDWNDLAASGLSVITPNPKTSGGARWNYLAAWGYALKQAGGTAATARDLVAGIFKNVAVLDSGARGSTTTFSERNIGDVLVAWENEALLLKKGKKGDEYEIVRPSVSIRAEPPVSVVDTYAKRRGTAEVAEAYLRALYDEPAQEIAAKHHFRPTTKSVLEKYREDFPDLTLFTVNDLFESWASAQAAHFDDNAIFDQLYVAK